MRLCFSCSLTTLFPFSHFFTACCYYSSHCVALVLWFSVKHCWIHAIRKPIAFDSFHICLRPWHRYCDWLLLSAPTWLWITSSTALPNIVYFFLVFFWMRQIWIKLEIFCSYSLLPSPQKFSTLYENDDGQED